MNNILLTNSINLLKINTDNVLIHNGNSNYFIYKNIDNEWLSIDIDNINNILTNYSINTDKIYTNLPESELLSIGTNGLIESKSL